MSGDRDLDLRHGGVYSRPLTAEEGAAFKAAWFGELQRQLLRRRRQEMATNTETDPEH